MKITEMTVFSYQANYTPGTYTMSGGRTSTGYPSLVVRLVSDTGIEGWAETSPAGSDYLPTSFTAELAALQELGPHIVGLDPRSPAVIMEVMDRIMLSGTAAKSVIDFACWDLFGKVMGLPTYTLLGGRMSDEIPAFSTVGIGSLKTNVKKAHAEIEKGITALQVKIGDDPITDAKRVRAIREAVPDHVSVWADANTGWNLEQALTYVRALGQDITVPLEQPCKTLSDCAEVGRRTGIPIMLDECIVTMTDLFAAHAAGVTGINLKPSRVGGLTKARILRDAAVALDMMVVIDDTWGSALASAQSFVLATTTRKDRLRGVGCFMEWTDPLIADVPRVQTDGCVYLTDSPGNGFGEVDVTHLGEPLCCFKS